MNWVDELMMKDAELQKRRILDLEKSYKRMAKELEDYKRRVCEASDCESGES